MTSTSDRINAAIEAHFTFLVRLEATLTGTVILSAMRPIVTYGIAKGKFGISSQQLPLRWRVQNWRNAEVNYYALRVRLLSHNRPIRRACKPSKLTQSGHNGRHVS
jgi:hypothetical protein